MVCPHAFQAPLLNVLRAVRHQSYTTVGVTRLLYQEQGDLHQHEATIESIEELPAGSGEDDEGSHAILLDETIFHVRGGGQNFDLGSISLTSDPSAVFDVKAVRQAEQERVPHFGRFVSTDSRPLQEGDRVKMSIDVDRRLLNSRLHTAGHILGCATMQLSREGVLPDLIETKASHYPDAAAVEFRGLIDGKFKDNIQVRVDELVKKALPVKICFWDRQECEAHGITHFPEKLGGGEEKKFRTVLIGEVEAYPCGGTHVADTSGVGKIIVRRISRQKGTSKVSYTLA
jgi:Ser-tRNA(Ala) deacylase AlaX